MKPKFTMQDLRENLKRAIYESCLNSTMQNKIISSIAERNYDMGFVSGVLEGNTMLDSLSLTDLGVFALEIYNITDLGYINPSTYFEDVELERITKYKKEEIEDNLEYPVVFEDVRQVAPDIWTVVVPSNFIVELGRSNMLNYEFETQREAKIIETDEGIILTPTVNADSVVEIEQKLLTDEFIPNTLTFNLPFRDRGNFKWDAKLKKWILLAGKLNIIDGYHRYLGITAASRKKNINYNFEIRLTNFDDDKAKRFIVQEDKQNPISKEYIKSIDETDKVTQIISQLNGNTKSELKGKITTDRNSIKSGYALVTFELIYKTISRIWTINTINEADEIFDYLRLFFNKIIDLHSQEFQPQKRNLINDYSLSNERMFVVYLILARILQNNDNWRSEIEKALQNINLESEVIKEYIDIPYSVAARKFSRYFKMANNIVEVIISGE